MASNSSPHIDLMIIGAQKAGTSSLLNYMRDHTEICAHHGNEFSYFADDNAYEQGYKKAFPTYFSKKSFKKVVAKNVTICSNETALKRLKEHNPDVKIVFMLREPASRAYSSYTMGVSQGWMKNSFEDVAQTVLDKSEDSQLYQLFISLGIYASQLETLGRYFEPSQIRIVLFEDLKNDSSQVCLNLFEWLNVSPDPIESKKAHNVTTKAKSSSLAGLINQLKIEGNPLKQFVKRVLPYSMYSKLGSSIEKLNETEAKFEPIGIESKEILSAHYRSKTQKLQLLLSQEKYAQSIESCSRDNWLFKSPTSS